MTVRSIILFVHIVGVLVLFIGIAFEYMSLASLRRSTMSEPETSWARLYGALPRVYGLAFGLIAASGFYMARGGYGAFPWVRLSLGLMVLMGLLGGLAIRARTRAIRNASPRERATAASDSWVRVSLFMRAAMSLAAVYLMIDKPDLNQSLLVTGGAVASGTVFGLLNTGTSQQPLVSTVAEFKQ
jgi:hypothetical protein